MVLAKRRLPPLPTIRDVIRVYNLTALKQLAQNFLMDMNMCRKIVGCAGPIEGHHVCEVGPGPGGITRAILEQDVSKLTVVERDGRFLPSLELLAEASDQRMEIIHGDILRTDLREIFPKSLKRDWMDDPPMIKIIGNLPFNVSTPLLIRWLEAMSDRTGPFYFGRVPLTLTFQREVAERIVAPIMGDQRCRLSAMCQYVAHVQHKYTMPGKVFVPAPKVDAGVVTIVPRQEPLIKLPFKLVEKVCRHVFHFRRHPCLKGIKTLFPPNMEDQLAEEICRRARINPKVSCTFLSVEEIGDMCHVYDEICRRIPGLYHFYYREPVDLDKLALLDFPFPPDYSFKDSFPHEQTL